MSGSPGSECGVSSKPRQNKMNGMETERRSLCQFYLSDCIVGTLFQVQKKSTNFTYYRVRKAFWRVSAEKNWNPMLPTVSNILEFLQRGLECGLAYNSLRVQVSALSAMSNKRWAFDLLVVRFLKAAMKIRPPVRSFFPKWDLSFVLKALSLPQFDPISTCSLFHLTLRTIFLTVIASMRRVSELYVFSSKELYCLVLQDRIVLRPVPNFLFKVSTSFHMNQESIHPAFPEDGSEDEWKKLDLVVSLAAYLERTKNFRKPDILFVFP